MIEYLKKIDRKFLLLGVLMVNFIFHISYMNMEVQGAHSWRQSQTMWNVKNFVRHDSNILNPRVSHFNGVEESNFNRYEFPVMQWVIGMTMKVTGEYMLVMRLYMFLFSSLGIVGFFYLCRFFLKDKFVAILASYFMLFSPIYYYYSVCPIPDVLALSCGIWYLYFILSYFDNRRTIHLLLASFSMLIATCAKLPFLMFTIVSIVYFFRTIKTEKKISLHNLAHAIIQLLIISPALLWYKWVMAGWGSNSIVKGVFNFDLNWSQFRDIILFNVFEMFPFSMLYPLVWIFFVLGIKKFRALEKGKIWINSLVIMTLFYYVFEFNAIQTSHDYYMMPFLPWLYVLVAYGVSVVLSKNGKLWKWLLPLCIVIAPIYSFTLNYKKYQNQYSWFQKDAFAYRDQLRAAVPRDELCIMLSDYTTYLLSYQIDKRGFVFGQDMIPIGWISDMIINENVTYMYSSSSEMNEDRTAKNYINKHILTAGTIQVFQLKSKDDVLKMENGLKVIVSQMLKQRFGY